MPITVTQLSFHFAGIGDKLIVICERRSARPRCLRPHRKRRGWWAQLDFWGMDSSTTPQFSRDCEPFGLGATLPCPRVCCRYHLANDDSGKARRVMFGLAESLTRPTCAMAVANEGEHGPDEIAELMGLSVSSVELIQREGLARLRVALTRTGESAGKVLAALGMDARLLGV